MSFIMAIKYTAFLMVFIVSFGFSSSEQKIISPVRDVWLSEIGDDKLFTPPDRLVIGIDLAESAYYKLSEKQSVIKGGLFKRGISFIEIDARELFNVSGTHVYTLDLKIGDLVLSETIEIDIQLDSEEADEQAKDQVMDPEYKLSMFIGDQLVLSSKKFVSKGVQFEVEKFPLPENYGPFYEVRGKDKNPMQNSFSIIDAVSVALGLIKKMIDKKRKQNTKPLLKKYRQLTLTFIKRDSEGVTREIHAVVTLN